MAEPQSNAPLRAPAGAPTSGVIHVRTRLTADFTVIANALAQRRGSAVTVGVAAYILSLPDGASVSIAALCDHFAEGEILISRALRELEADGYLERRCERGPGGVLRTRTYFYDMPGQGHPTPTPLAPPRPRRPKHPHRHPSRKPLRKRTPRRPRTSPPSPREVRSLHRHGEPCAHRPPHLYRAPRPRLLPRSRSPTRGPSSSSPRCASATAG